MFVLVFKNNSTFMVNEIIILTRKGKREENCERTILLCICVNNRCFRCSSALITQSVKNGEKGKKAKEIGKKMYASHKTPTHRVNHPSMLQSDICTHQTAKKHFALTYHTYTYIFAYLHS